jgi:hypothetical protein
MRLIWTQVLHWTAVVFAMYLVFVADVKQMMSDFASSLMRRERLQLAFTWAPGGYLRHWNRSRAWGSRHRLVRGKNTTHHAAETLALFAIIAVFVVLDHRRRAKDEF